MKGLVKTTIEIQFWIFSIMFLCESITENCNVTIKLFLHHSCSGSHVGFLEDTHPGG